MKGKGYFYSVEIVNGDVREVMVGREFTVIAGISVTTVRIDRKGRS